MIGLVPLCFLCVCLSLPVSLSLCQSVEMPLSPPSLLSLSHVSLLAHARMQGARMTSLFDAKNEAHELRQKYKAARKAVVVDKGALRLAQRQLDHLKARAEAGDLAPKVAAEEVEAHKKAMAMLRAKESEAESESRKLEHEIFLKGQAVP